MSMPIIIDDEEYLSTLEACQFLDVSYPTLQKLAKRHSIVPKTRGVKSTRYYAKSELEPILRLRDVPRSNEE